MADEETEEPTPSGLPDGEPEEGGPLGVPDARPEGEGDPPRGPGAMPGIVEDEEPPTGG
jgi:hypothetical protein